MADDDNTHSYQVNQDNKEYIISTQLLNDALRVECQDNNVPGQPLFAQIYSLNNFKDMDFYFQPFNYIYQIQNELDKTIEKQTVSIFTDNDNSINVSFVLKNNQNSANIILQLPRDYAEQQHLQKPKEDTHNYEFQGRCSCPLDNERIDKLEADSGKLQTDHEFLRNEINQLMEKINALNSRISKLKDDNAQLNQKTLALREENNSRRVEANRLRENNEAIKRQNQQLREKKNRLEFLLKEHHDPNTNQFLTNTNAQTPFGAKAMQIENINQTGQMPGGAMIMPSIAPVGVGANNKNNKLNNDRPIIINNEHESMKSYNTEYAFSRGTIIRENSELEMIVNKINKYNRPIKIDLIYKASTDTDTAKAFHDNCDSAKNTIVLVETVNGKRFGGYTSKSWDGDCIDKKDPNAFIFSLDKMETYGVILEKDAIGCYPDFGPVFLGCQIRIYDNAFTKGGSTFVRGVSYLTNEDYELTGGEKLFGVKEIEVYEVKFE